MEVIPQESCGLVLYAAAVAREARCMHAAGSGGCAASYCKQTLNLTRVQQLHTTVSRCILSSTPLTTIACLPTIDAQARMAETLAALSLAGNIVQFIEFGCRLFTKSQELHGSAIGVAAEDDRLAIIAGSLRNISQDLEGTSPSPGGLSPEASDLEELVDECKRVANELLGALDKLKSTNAGNTWKYFRDSLKRVWEEERINSVAQRLNLCSFQVTICLLKLLRYKKNPL